MERDLDLGENISLLIDTLGTLVALAVLITRLQA